MPELVYIAILFFFVSLIYSSAGFGGGSSYLAILSFFPIAFSDLRIIALVCNIVVVSSSVILFHKYRYLKWKKTLTIVSFSIPMAFLGGRFILTESFFFILLGSSLLLAAMLMLYDRNIKAHNLPASSNAFIGGGIGLLSGLVGIGGGIFLSPVLHLSTWDAPKTIASTSAFFILVNSIAGLIGQLSVYSGNISYLQITPLVVAVLIGGQLGVRFTIFQFQPVLVKRITALVILFVACRLLVRYLF